MNGWHYFFDDGTEFNPDLYPKPGLCLTCKKNECSDDPEDEILCNLTRLDQHREEVFTCYAYEPQ
jgi:hypothetical protein